MNRNPGAICALSFDALGQAAFKPPRPVRFREALCYINEHKSSSARAVVAIDQPTIVPNASGMRPAERVAASPIGSAGGGVQPANKGANDKTKAAMFGPDAPIWRFKKYLGAEDDPERARNSDRGLFLIEVFPALALLGLYAPFAGLNCAPKYNPENRKKFRKSDWDAVVKAVTETARGMKLAACAEWCSTHRIASKPKPDKRDQDQLDAVICALIGYIWIACERSSSVVLGDLERGYIVTPVSRETATRLEAAGIKKGVPCE